MTHHPWALAGLPSDFDLADESATIAPPAPLSGGHGGAIFEERHLKSMRDVFSAVCATFRFHPDSDDARRTSLAIVRHAASGTSDRAELMRAVEAELRADRQVSDE